MKKIELTLICLCFLFLFGGCYSSDFFYPPNPEEDYFYDVYWYFQGNGTDAGGSVLEEYYFRIYNTIYQYSVVAQELMLLLSYEDAKLDDHAINDDYIFL